MDSDTIVEPADTGRRPRTAWRQRWFHGLGWSGFAIVAIASLIDAVRAEIKYVVMEPFEVWIVGLLITFAEGVALGIAILLAVVWARNRVPRRGARQYAMVFAAVVTATALGMIVLAARWSDGTFWAGDPTATPADLALWLGTQWIRHSLQGLLIAGAWLYVRAEADHVAALERCAVDSARMDQQTAEARLQMLEAQIEPHFLFNALANVKRLYDTDPAGGARMLRNLKDYLAVALPQMREMDSTLGREVAHATAYLNIQQVRMGRRLKFALDLPETLHNARMPPLMLLTLTENAIKHGLGPAREGGRIDLRASVDSGQLRVQVADTGQGFAQSIGAGTGLANIRARLAALFGEAASLSLAVNPPRGVIATIALPYQEAMGSGGRA